ncbi:DNA-directed RNA polymerase I subunit RPA43-like [Argonauta hians]
MPNNLALGIDKARSLLQDPASLCILKDSEEEIAIPPVFIGKLNEGVKFSLDSEINSFSNRLNGVILAYKDLKFLTTEGRIQGDRPFIYCKIKISYILFQPKIGSILTGIIKEIYSSHVVCVVHELFNATVIKLRENSTWNVNAFKVNHLLEFTVVELYSTHKLFSMKGKLNRIIEKDSVVVEDVNKKSIKRELEVDSEDVCRESKIPKLEEMHRDVDREDECPESKMVKLEETEVNGYTHDVSDDFSHSVKKKKKKKKIKVEMEGDI